MNAPAPARPAPAHPAPLLAVPPTSAELALLPPGPLTTAELDAAVPRHRPGRESYRRIWHGMYRREDQHDDLRLRTLALARTWPEGVLRGRSAALLWGDDSAPADAPPEIWLPSNRKTAPGRVYRFGRMAPGAVTVLDGVRLTTPLRTCRDLAADLPHEDAVVAVDRLCAAVPDLGRTLAAALAHPAGSAGSVGRGLDRLAAVVADTDPRAARAESSRARVVLAAHDAGDFAHGHEIRPVRKPLRPELADPVARCVVEVRTAPRTVDEQARDEREWAALRAAGWTILVVRTHRCRGAAAAALAGAVAGAGGGEAWPGPDLGRESVADRALAALRTRWPSTEALAPLTGPATDDPHGMWAPVV